jgi:predicted secreted protein
MPTHAGSEGTVRVGANAIAEIRSYSLEESGDTIDDSTMGDVSRTYLAGLRTFTGTIDVLWDETNTTGQLALTVGATITLNVYPEGAATGDMYYHGSAIVTGRSISASYDGLVEMSISVQGTGPLTQATAT